MNKITLQLVFTLFCIPAVAQINPSTTTDLIMPGGPYTNIENTGAAISDLNGIPPYAIHAYTWDGDNPGIAVYEPGLGVFTAALPNGATDPDIVIGNGGLDGVVVYEYNGGVEYRTFNYMSGILTINSPQLIHANAIHPNIDNPTDCYSIDPVVVVFETPGSSNDIEYSVGKLTGSFAASTVVPHLGVNQNQLIIDRINPDVQVYEQGKYLFTSQGVSSVNNNDYVDVYRVGMNANPFTTTTILSPGEIAYPRIDGVVNHQLVTYDFTVTYLDQNGVHNGMPSTPNAIIQPGTSLSGNPVVAYAGDFHDVAWPSNAVNNPKVDIIGLEYHGNVPYSFYKELNDQTTSGLFEKKAVSLAGSCSFDLASCWTGNNELYYKAALGNGSTSYKTISTDLYPTRVEIYNMTGQILENCLILDFESVISTLPSGLYIVYKFDDYNHLISFEKLIN